MFTTYNNPINIEDMYSAENYTWGIYLFLFILFIIIFIFRKQLTQMKETMKSKLRSSLYQYVETVSVKNDTVQTQESGFLLRFVSFLDERFLSPADVNNAEESYNFLLEENEELEKGEVVDDEEEAEEEEEAE